MDIFRHQFRRVLFAPFFLSLLAAFLVLDLYQIASISHEQRAVNLINDVAGQTGVRIDADFEKKFSPIVETNQTGLRALCREKTGKELTDPDKMIAALEETDRDLTEDEKGRIADAQTILQLNSYIKIRGGFYQNYNLSAQGKAYLKRENVTGAPAAIITQNCAALQKRVEQVKTDGEADTLFFPGVIYEVHGFLYGTLMRSIGIESAILSVLAMLYLVNYEFTCGTAGLAYTCRRGRSLSADQFRAALLAGMLVPAVLMAVVLPVFFANFHFSNVWGTYVSSAMNAEKNGLTVDPYVTWRPMTMLQYLWANIGLVLLLQLVFCLLAFGAAILCRNNYIGFLCFALAFLVLMNPLPVPFNNVLPMAWIANPSLAWRTCRAWLTGQMDESQLYPWYNFAVCALWSAVAAALVFFGVRRFRRTDL